jgi:hypothetical protein
MHILEDALGDDIVQIGLHEFKEQVDILVVIRPDRVVELDDVRMVQLLQDLDLAVGALGVSCMLECVEDLLQGEDAL